jgi:N-acetylmuramic acid 6-phosphate etherase
MQIVRRALGEPAIEDEEAVEAPDGGHRPCDRPRRMAAAHPLPDERLERVAIERFDLPLDAGGKLGQPVEVARVALEGVLGEAALVPQVIEIHINHGDGYDSIRGPKRFGPSMAPRSKWQGLPTEAINPSTLAIDKLSSADIVEGMLNEDRKMLAAVQREKSRIAVGVDIITNALRKGGRIIFVGAGTSGRLGVLESAEMPPTFGTDPALVQAIMAGGKSAIVRPREGVEDNYEEGARSAVRLRFSKNVVIGVSASGMTQFVRGALTRARRTGSKIIFVTCDPHTELQTFVDVMIAPAVGPEVIAGSTRLKAGTATKIVLNMLTTGAMVRTGKTYGNLMVDVQTGSEKLKDRARRIIGIVTGLEYDDADKLLRRARWNVKAAIVMQKSGLTYPKAVARLRHANDVSRDAIGEDVEARLKELLSVGPASAGP